MKVMLYADWMNFKQLIRSLAFILVVFIAASLLWGGPAFLNMITVMISIMVPASLCSVDKAYGWDKFSLSLPILRRDVIASKYVLSGIVSAVMLVLSCTLAVIYCSFVDASESLAENICALLLCEAVAIILMGIVLTASVKWGVEKARYILMACVWIPIIAGTLLNKAGVFDMISRQADAHLNTSWLNALTPGQYILLALVSVGIGLVIYLLCYALSVHIYQKIEL